MKSVLKLVTSAALASTIAVSSNHETRFFNEDKHYSTNIQSWNISSLDLMLQDSSYLGKMDIIDLTVLTGISSLNIFKKLYSAIQLPNFYGGIALFSSTATVNGFTISTEDWQENWRTKQIKLLEDSETIGSAYIYGLLSTEIEIIKHPRLHHLLMRIHFYGSGDFASTSSHPLATINSGWVLSLIQQQSL